MYLKNNILDELATPIGCHYFNEIKCYIENDLILKINEKLRLAMVEFNNLDYQDVSRKEFLETEINLHEKFCNHSIINDILTQYYCKVGWSSVLLSTYGGDNWQTYVFIRFYF